MKEINMLGEDVDPYAELVKEKVLELFCEVCGHYPLEPVHGHFRCSECGMQTKCCEGI